MAAGADKYVNVMLHSVTMSGANTLTFDEMTIGLSTFDRIGILITRLEYYLSAATVSQLESNDDYYQLGITGSNAISDIGSDERSVYNKIEEFVIASGTPATAMHMRYPIIEDLSDLPGGGLLIPPRPLYLAMDSSGFSSAGKGFVRMYFVTQQLKDTDYFELLETFRFFE